MKTIQAHEHERMQRTEEERETRRTQNSKSRCNWQEGVLNWTDLRTEQECQQKALGTRINQRTEPFRKRKCNSNTTCEYNCLMRENEVTPTHRKINYKQEIEK